MVFLVSKGVRACLLPCPRARRDHRCQLGAHHRMMCGVYFGCAAPAAAWFQGSKRETRQGEIAHLFPIRVHGSGSPVGMVEMSKSSCNGLEARMRLSLVDQLKLEVSPRMMRKHVPSSGVVTVRGGAKGLGAWDNRYFQRGHRCRGRPWNHSGASTLETFYPCSFTTLQSSPSLGFYCFIIAYFG